MKPATPNSSVLIHTSWVVILLAYAVVIVFLAAWRFRRKLV